MKHETHEATFLWLSRHQIVQLLLIESTLAVAVVSWFTTEYPSEVILQHLPTFGVALIMGWYLTRQPLPWLSFNCFLTFMYLHCLGAHWIYSFVPYAEWIHDQTGFEINQAFGWQRNHFDRLIHFASGFLGAPIAMQWLARWNPPNRLQRVFLAVAIILGLGAAYEIVEWILATVLSPHQAESYNGQQGDVWDPQKDMALAGIGSLMTAWLPNQFTRVTHLR